MLKTLKAAAVLSAMLAHGPATAADLTLGVLTDLSGLFSDASGKGAVEATRMAVDDARADMGDWSVRVVSADHQGKADVGAEIARRWIDREGVTAIVNVPNSAVALAVQQITKEKKRIFLMTGGASADLTGKSCSPYSAHWTDDTFSLSSGVIRALMARGKRSFYFVTADYAFGYSIQAEATRVIEAEGGKVLGAVRHPTGTADFSSFLLQAQASGAEVIALANAGGDTIQAVKQAHEYAISSSGQSLVAMGLFITDVHSLGLEVAQGLYLSTGFYWDLDDETRRWSKRFFDVIGRMPTREQAETYSAVRHYLRAVAATRSADAAEDMAWMKANAVDDFYAHGGKLRADGRFLHRIFLAQVKTPAESKGAWDYYKLLSPLDPDRAFRPLAEGGCYFVKP